MDDIGVRRHEVALLRLEIATLRAEITGEFAAVCAEIQGSLQSAIAAQIDGLQSTGWTCCKT